MAENVVLDIPFDEPDGSTIAYDYSPNAYHAAIEAGRFIPGKFNNCVYFPGEGKAEIIPPVFNWNADFTFTIWMQAAPYNGKPTNSYVLVKFTGLNNFVKIPLNTRFSSWTHFAMTQEGNTMRVYIMGQLIGSYTYPGGLKPTGFSVLNDSPHDTGGWSYFDMAKVIEGVALPPDDIDDEINNVIQPMNFSFNNVNLKSYGIYVDGIEGVFDLPVRKDPLKVDWPDYDGEVIDLKKPIYGKREIKLSCWQRSVSKDADLANWLNFISVFQQPGTVRFSLDYGSKPLIFHVWAPEGIPATKNKWLDGKQIKRFTLTLEEPIPFKRVVRGSGNLNISFSTPKMVTIYWGDGVATKNHRGSVNVSRNVPENSYTVIAGNIDDITSFGTNGIIVHDKI